MLHLLTLEKAFDSVIRTKLWAILRKNGLKGKMYIAVVSMYNVVKSKSKVWEWFD